MISAAQQIPVGAPVPQYSDKPAANEDKDSKPGGTLNGAGAAVDNSTYKVGPGDVLKILVWKEPNFSLEQISVQQNGKITLPLVGDVQAGDTTPKEIEASVAQALTKYLKTPLVTVSVLQVFSKKYYLDGAWNKPGEYALAAPTTVLEAISKSGGMQEFANKKKIYILRGSTRIPFNYNEVIHGKKMEQNIPLEPGDHIFVP